MKLRSSVCLFAAAAVCMSLLTVAYLSLRQDYQELNHRYEHSLEVQKQTGFEREVEQKENNAAHSAVQAETQVEKEVFHTADAFYYVTLKNDEVIAYTGDHAQICMRTQIDEEELAAAFIQELRQGIYLENLPALYEYLENCSS